MTHYNLCDSCETVVHCLKHGCVPLQSVDWEAIAADQAMTIALLKAEQQAQQEPVAQQAAGYVAVCEALEQVGIGVLSRAPSKLQIEEMCNAIRTLTTPPPASKPLTDEQIYKIANDLFYGNGPCDTLTMCRAIEAAHGIEEKK